MSDFSSLIARFDELSPADRATIADHLDLEAGEVSALTSPRALAEVRAGGVVDDLAGKHELVDYTIADRNAVKLAGHEFLASTAREYVELFVDRLDDDDDSITFYPSDLAFEVADGAVDVYTVGARDQWLALGGFDLPLADIIDLVDVRSPSTDFDDLVTVGVYEVASGVAHHVAAICEEAFSDAVEFFEELDGYVEDAESGYL